MRYFYTPIYYDPNLHQYQPGREKEGVIIAALLPTPCRSPMCDKGDAQRFVLEVPEASFEAPDDWQEKTKEEVNTDYPDLIP